MRRGLAGRSTGLKGFTLGLAAVAMSVALTGAPLNEAYRYVACLLTVQLLLIDLLCVMDLPADQLAFVS